LELLESKQVIPNEIPGAYAYSTFASLVRSAFRKYPQLGKFSGLKHSKVREEFGRIDCEIIQLRGKDVASQCIRSSVPPSGANGTRVDEKTEMVLLNHLLPQQRPRMPVRKMLKRAGKAVQTLTPCFMMGPQAVAQYLSPGATAFDLVIMDEASQLKPEEAIGAIARGSQLVVVGDPKQLPPTSFFTRMTQVGEDDDQFTTTDAESILDVCLAHFRPTRHLRWHYRSQHHSLIAFSNHYFYRNLVVFPSPYGHSSRLGVRATYLADAVYEDQTNYKEAIRVVDAVVDHIKSRPDESLGVVTLNLKQRELITELLDERLQTVSGADNYREKWRSEAQPLFIKNLENVQGDERDAIIISTTFGKPAGAEAVRQNFGPISRHGGWRRLNVLFTRAKRSIALFTSMRPEDIIVDGTTPDGTKALRNYLEYARTGSLAVAEETGLEPDSDFEVSVINVLKARGYEVTPQLGVAGYRIDIAVKHPEYPGVYLAAVECDGAGYHSAVSVRDRDRIRQEILESMGWRGRIWRIWSTDWFRMPRHESEKLVGFVEELRKTWKPEHSSGQSWVEIGKTGEASDDRGTRSSDLEVIKSTLLDFGDDRSVRVGDTVRYADVRKVDDILTVQITEDKTDLSAGFVHRGTPLAQTLLGAVAGDDVTMHLPGASARTFRIIEVKRPNA
jgi:very-short-patch-repair endonuclease